MRFPAPVNLNKVFPRLSIRSKLVIAFTCLAALPVATVSVVGTWVTIARIRELATLTLARDLGQAQTHTARLLAEAGRHVDYLTREILGPQLLAPSPRWREAGRTVRSFLGPEPVFHQIKVVDLEGRVLFAASAESEDEADPGEESGVYYAWRAAEASPGPRQLFSIELREGSGRRTTVVPAVAILVPVREGSGALRGAVVGEAYASGLFEAIETSAPGYEGVTGLVDGNGAVLYHSANKRSWANRLGGPADPAERLGPDSATLARMARERAGTLRIRGGRMVGFRTLSLGGAEGPALTLYREVPLARLERPVRRFLVGTTVSGLLVVASVLLLGTLAADQFTKPIYGLRSAVRALAAGGEPATLEIATNDEIEDLAYDVEAMGREIAAHRSHLERLVAERTGALEAAHAELATILEGSADAIVGLDREGLVRLWNGGAERLFGWTEAEAMGREITTTIGPDGPSGERERAFIAAALEEEGAIVNFQTTRRTKDGEPLPVSVTHTLLCDGAGRMLGSSLILRDNRAQARLDEHMRRSERLAAVSVMAAGLAHEINNPLGILANRIECMQRDAAAGAKDGLARDLDVLQSHVSRLRALTMDLLRFARDDGAPPGPVQLDAVAARVVGLLERAFVARNLQLRIERDAELPLLMGDAQALETVVLNLLLNAADAAPSGGEVTVCVRALPGRQAVRLVVRDTGPGIPPELRARVFEPFFTTKGPGGGTGLGLAVCRSIVERHHGSIAVDSAPGQGAAFVVTLPLQPVGIA